jgi:hypothetical protein
LQWFEGMRAPGDRRTKIRFEVFGVFWGTFDAGGAVHLHDLTPHGALIEANKPLAIESVQSVCLMVDGQQAIADARVRHVRLSTQAQGRFLVGIEFLSTSTVFLEAVERLISLGSASA